MEKGHEGMEGDPKELDLEGKMGLEREDLLKEIE